MVVSRREKGPCPLCLQEVETESFPMHHSVLEYHCPRCGEFVADRRDVSMSLSPNTSERAANHPDRLSSLVRERNIQGLIPYALLFSQTDGIEFQDGYELIHVSELLRKWPHDPIERIDRAFCNLVRMSQHLGDQLRLEMSRDCAALFSHNKIEVRFILNTLSSEGWLDVKTSSDGIHCVITHRGWSHYRDMSQSAPSKENPVFVAMDFGGSERRREMLELYEQGLAPGIRDAGYKPERVDLREHNEYIVDEILACIRRSPFIVADFTYQNRGVYFESGFARGLGLQVIHCCRNGEEGALHFDTSQINTIIWHDHEDLIAKLKNRIVGSIGKGPHGD